MAPARGFHAASSCYRGAGFIGSHVVDELMARGDEVHIIDNFSTGRREHVPGLPAKQIHEGDLRDAAWVREAVAAIAPERVFHLAAIHFIPYCNAHPTEAVLINIQAIQNLLDALAGTPVERLFFASTAAVYPPKEGEHVDTDPVDPMDIYGAAKAAGEALVRGWSAAHGKAVTDRALHGCGGSLLRPCEESGPEPRASRASLSPYRLRVAARTAG